MTCILRVSLCQGIFAQSIRLERNTFERCKLLKPTKEQKQQPGDLEVITYKQHHKTDQQFVSIHCNMLPLSTLQWQQEGKCKNTINDWKQLTWNKYITFKRVNLAHRY